MSKDIVLTDDQVLQPVLNVLSENDAKTLVELKDSLTKTWQTNQIFRTETEAKYSVLNHSKFPTKASRYFQSVREQNMQFENIMTASFQLRRLQLKQQELEQNIADADGIEKMRLKIDLDEVLFSLANLTRQIHDRVREVKMWEQFKEENNDGSFDDTDVNSSQLKSLELQLMNRAKALTNNSNSGEVQNIMGPLATIQAERTPEPPKQQELKLPKVELPKLKIQK